MIKKKAAICTSILAFLLVSFYIGVHFIPTAESGLEISRVLTGILSAGYLGDFLVKFYNWLIKE